MTEQQEWLDWRRQGIGASDVAAILGLSPWASPWSIWADKVGLTAGPDENEVMTAGKWLELAVGPWFEHETGMCVSGQQLMVEHPLASHHRCTLDGVTFDGPHDIDAVYDDVARTIIDAQLPLGGLEIKTAQPGKRWGEIPAHYQAQGQWQMHVTGFARVWFAVLMGRRLDIFELARDDEDIDFMVEQVEEFWHRFVLTGEQPPLDGSKATSDALAAAYGHPDESMQVSFDDHSAELLDWREAKRAEADAQVARARAEAKVKARLGDATEGTHNGQVVVSWRPRTKTTTCKHCGAQDTTAPFRVLLNHHKS